MQKIRKVVIPVAGSGTRFLPATKAMPKEMLPIVDKPIIQYIVEEAVNSGIEDIILVTGWHKRSIEDHFDYPYELERRLLEAGKEKQAAEVKAIADLANFVFVRQKGPYGNGTPVMNARHVVGNEPFAVMWGDEFIHSTPPRLKQLIDAYEKYGVPCISAVRVPEDRTNKYGIADVTPVEGNVFKINRIVEKPKPGEAPSNLARTVPTSSLLRSSTSSSRPLSGKATSYGSSTRSRPSRNRPECTLSRSKTESTTTPGTSSST